MAEYIEKKIGVNLSQSNKTVQNLTPIQLASQTKKDSI